MVNFKIERSFIVCFLNIILLYGISVRIPILISICSILLYSIVFLQITKPDRSFLFRSKLPKVFVAVYLLFMVYLLSSLLMSSGSNLLFWSFRNSIYFLFVITPITFFNVITLKKYGLKKYLRSLFHAVFLMSIIVGTIYFQNYIAADRYQQVGNLAAFCLVLSFLHFKEEKLLSLLGLVTSLYILLFSGSRQAIVASLIVIILIILYNFILTNKKKSGRLKFLLFFMLFLPIYWWISSLDFTISNSFRTIARMIKLFETIESNSRVIIWTKFLDKVELYPQFYNFSLGQDPFELAHNFFIEYMLCTGLIFGIFFILTIFRTLFKGLKNVHELVFISLIFFIPFNVSSGLSSAKYFIVFLLTISLFIKDQEIRLK